MKTTSHWRHRCRPIIRDALAALPAGATRADAEKALHPLYPFGEREHHPYRMWCAEVRAQLDARFGPKPGRAQSPDVVLGVGGPECRMCRKIRPHTWQHSKQRCLACLPHWARWEALPSEAWEEFRALLLSRDGVEIARDWSEEFMGGLPLAGRPL